MTARLGLLCDFREEGWKSMDLVGDMLFRELRTSYADSVSVERLCPSFQNVFGRLPGLGHSRFGWNADRLWNRFQRYPRWLRSQAQNFDLFHLVDHSYAQLAWELPPERTVAQCHDIDAFRCLLEPKADRRPKWFRAMTERILNGLARAAHVITISESTRQQILSYKLISPDRLSVVHLGVHPDFLEPADPAIDQELNRLLGANRPDAVDILHVGSCAGRKRIDVLLKVFAKIAREFPQARLIKAGESLSNEQTRLAQRLGIERAIVLMPHLQTLQLAALYRRSSVLLQTSEVEGFGLPVAEALACGCPVVASDIEVLREVAGTAAAFEPVGEISLWTEAVLNILRSCQEDADFRVHLSRRGREQARRFSWAETARGSVQIYRKLLAA